MLGASELIETARIRRELRMLDEIQDGYGAGGELKPCPFCGRVCCEVIDEHQECLEQCCDEPEGCEAEASGYRAVVCDFNAGGCGAKSGWRQTEEDAVAAWNARAVDGSTSDGYHTFDELYYHRTALFACLVSMQPRQMAFKSRKHADGTMYDGMFIAGIYTSRGWCTYHCEDRWWPLFDCSEREFAPEWDGHTPSDAIHRLMTDFLPEQEVRGEVAE